METSYSSTLSQSSLGQSQMESETWTKTLPRQQLIQIEGITLKIPMIKIQETVIDKFFRGYTEIEKIKKFINDIFQQMLVSKVQALAKDEEKIMVASNTSNTIDLLCEAPKIQKFFKELLIDLTYSKVPYEIGRPRDLVIFTASTVINNPHLVPKTPEKKIDAQTFIEHVFPAVQSNNSYLLSLCKSFAESNPLFGEELDLSRYTSEDLIILQKATKHYLLPKLKKNIASAFKNSIQLDASFTKICHAICESKDSQLKTFFIGTLKEKPELLEVLRNDKENECKDQWAAFVNLCTTIEI